MSLVHKDPEETEVRPDLSELLASPEPWDQWARRVTEDRLDLAERGDRPESSVSPETRVCQDAR